MSYIVLDLEWNQAQSSSSTIFDRLPFRLRGEIIQIGAVRMEAGGPTEEFRADIRPRYFRRINHRVGKLTGINKEMLRYGLDFETAIQWLHEWCGADDCLFLTWGLDDKMIMEQNLRLFNIKGDWISRWANLQKVYNLQIPGDGNQKSLASAMEHFGIEQTRTAHDALDDAYNTALVCANLDLERGLSQLIAADAEAAERRLEKARLRNNARRAIPSPPVEPMERREASGYTTIPLAFSDTELSGLLCPGCGETLENSRWINQGDGRYMTLMECPEHGHFLLRLKFKLDEDGTYRVTRLLYEANEAMRRSYAEKAKSKRKTRRSSQSLTRRQ